MYQALTEVGAPQFDEEDRKLASAIRETFSRSAEELRREICRCA